MNDRRKLGREIKLSLSSSSSGNLSAASQTKTIYVYESGEVLKTSGVTVTSNVTWATGSYSQSNGSVSISVTGNTSTSNSRSGTITIKYQGKSVTYSVSQKKDSVVSTTVNSCTVTNFSKTISNSSITYNNNTDGDVIATYTCKISATTTSTYESGNTTQQSENNVSMSWPLKFVKYPNTQRCTMNFVGQTATSVAGVPFDFITDFVETNKGGVSNLPNGYVSMNGSEGSYTRMRVQVRIASSPYTKYYTESNCIYKLTKTSNDIVLSLTS